MASYPDASWAFWGDDTNSAPDYSSGTCFFLKGDVFMVNPQVAIDPF